MRTRRYAKAVALVAGVLVAASLGACGSSDDGQEDASGAAHKLTIGLVQSQDFIQALPTRVAEAQGLFSKAGFDVKVVGFTSGSDLTKAMVGGSVDVATATGLEAVLASARGIDIQMFYGMYPESPMALIVPASSDIGGFADLKGKKVGITAAGSLTDYLAQAAAAKRGVAPDEATRVPLGAPSSLMTGMKHGDVDAFVLPVNFGFMLEASGEGKIAEKVVDVLGPETQFSVLMASKSYIDSKTDDLRKLTTVYGDAVTWIQQNKAEAVDLAVKELNMDPAIAEKTYDAYAQGFTPDGTLNEVALAQYAEALPELKIASVVPKQSDYLSKKALSAK